MENVQSLVETPDALATCGFSFFPVECASSYVLCSAAAMAVWWWRRGVGVAMLGVGWVWRASGVDGWQ